MPLDDATIEQIRAMITQDLVSSGKYKELAGLLQQRLRNSDWTEQVEILIRSAIHRDPAYQPSLEQIITQVEARAVGKIPQFGLLLRSI